METKTKNTIDDYINNLVDERVTAAFELDEHYGERLEALWLSLGLFDHTDFHLDYCYTFKTEADAWAFYRHAVANNPYALDAFEVSYSDTLGWSVS